MVLTPPDRRRTGSFYENFKVTRSASLLPRGIDPFVSGDDLNQLVSGSWLTKLALLVSLTCYLAKAFVLACRADVICSHWMVPSGLLGALISRILRKPHIVVEHSGALHLLTRRRVGTWLARFVIDGCDRIVTVSCDLKRKLLALCPTAGDKVETIPMGVSLPVNQVELGDRDPTLTVVFIGRLTEIKGLDVLLRAMVGLRDLRLIVAGDGELRDQLEKEAAELRVNAHFVGRIGAAQRDELLSKCDVVVIPSRVVADRTEGTPVVCLEAMAAGRAVIASQVGGLAEAIVDGENGLLFDSGDYLALQDKLRLVIDDEAIRKKLGESASRSAAAYDWLHIGSRYRGIIHGVLKKNDLISNGRIETARING